ncbi:extracellular solute-binding protein [Umezakia ovalisporum]|jgi:putative spermidine/putrescine transport system substrate-binding protein|uniref:Extracellular solute-binding protein n=2 Tax=Umezakia ovalisporum TaxID=75695 RepID=A0AA43KEM4_9CYAN|nr:extracellular solute-binding protein [Umezakia ovalisporum]MDH6055869.1 extracellular solute-binding protein [Umezakia ovalisporum FSS-43]MDH6063133.1 extracellular solute-binding protein [Umezakia ovalisporum FSS-62]MDH6068979.1 extracellular solute-binding protein [Umezakia ovalisporum APH033B]MDH6069688.1 extracellular solute-binding protein [Umezakia ovalisporum CobakiLakeA]MDH6076219.1 extracellular solute-binding protein [Umezakia ovalisporum CS-1034]
MDRRSFFLGAGGLGLSQLLVGCGGSNQTKFNVRLLKGSIPSQIVTQFRRSLEQQVQFNFSPVDQIHDLFKQLQTWQNKSETSNDSFWTRFMPFKQSHPKVPSDLVTLGDYWLKAAIEEKLIQPLEEAEVQQLKHWSALDQRWKQLVKRDNQGNWDTEGDVWAAPYRWGSTVIVYHREKFQSLDWTPQDWSDLWRDELRERISLLDQSREVVGLVLKKLGASYNTENLNTIPDLKNELRALNQQVKFYSSNNYLEPLIIGDTWLAVGWSTDIMSLLTNYPQLAVVIPKSGTAIWADLWVRPKGVKKDTFASQWIDFCWQPDIAKKISVLTRSNSPISFDITSWDLQKPFRNLLHSNSEVFNKSEFLRPLPPSAIEQYESLFTKMKQG